jgi:hypothetical protein
VPPAAWEGKTLAEICAQIKDPARNGGKDMAALVRHMAEDSLVGWGWTPGPGRQPAPGTHAEFGALIRAWAEAGRIVRPKAGVCECLRARWAPSFGLPPSQACTAQRPVGA